MPKARETCTRCSMRRQRCDKKQPCSRCLEAGEEESCTRTWAGGYDPKLHRVYPKPQTGPPRLPKTSWEHRSSVDEGFRNISCEASLTSSSSPSERDLGTPGSAFINDGVMIPDTNVTIASEPSCCPRPDHESSNRMTEDDICRPEYYVSLRQQKLLHLQDLLPPHAQVLEILEYHEACLLWLHNCIHGPTLRREVAAELRNGGEDRVRLLHTDLRWAALLYAVLSAAITCAPESRIRQWGYTRQQRQSLSKSWYEAAVECLILGNFNTRPHLCSIQAIQILGLSSNYLGLSDRQFTLHGTALRIAQSLGLHRIPSIPDGSVLDVPDFQISQETGRRTWWNLVVHDWFSIPYYDSFCIHPTQWNTSRPQCHAHNSEESAWTESELLADVINHYLDTATIMVEFHMATIACSNVTSRYQQVLKHDARLRQLCERPFVWDSASKWLRWARHAARISNAHKILMVHRHFLGKSFEDTVFAYTRWATAQASKTIIEEMELALEDPDRPYLWNDEASLIGAGVTLCLDTMHRSPVEAESTEHRKLVEKTLFLLAMCEESALASRGYRLLSAMMKDGAKDSIAHGTSHFRYDSANHLAMTWIPPMTTPEEIWPQITLPTSTDAIPSFSTASTAISPPPLNTTTTTILDDDPPWSTPLPSSFLLLPDQPTFADPLLF